MEGAQEVPLQAAVSLLKKDLSYLNSVNSRLKCMNLFNSKEITVSPNNSRHFKVKLSDLEKAIRIVKLTGVYGKLSGSPVYSSSAQDDALEGNSIDTAGEFDERLACPICHAPAFGAVMTKKCGHHFHQRCLSKALQNKKQCPMCRTPMKTNDFTELKHIKESRFLLESINDVKVLCTMGCGASVKFDMLKDHVRNECPKTTFLCKHGTCLHYANRSAIAHHEKTCGEATILCDCGQNIKLKNEQDHRRLECPMAQVKCEYCGQEGISRSGYSAHLDECKGTVPMSFVRKLEAKWEARLSEVEERLAELDTNKRRRTSSAGGS